MIIDPTFGAYTCTTNEFYGHASIFRRYLGVEDHRLTLVGRLQHGWTVDAKSFAFDDIVPLLVWAKPVEGKESVVVGAPFMYLPPVEEAAERAESYVLAFPSHTTTFAPAESSWFDDYAEFLASTYRGEKIIACLYYYAALDETALLAFSRRGIATTTCGTFYGNQQYLYKLKHLLAGAKLVTTPYFGTHSLYAAVAGRAVRTEGPESRLNWDPNKVPIHGWAFKEPYSQEWIAQNFPAYVRGDLAGQAEVAHRELGCKLGREELWNITKWILLAPSAAPYAKEI